MAQIRIIIDVDGRSFRRDDALAIADHIIEVAKLHTPDLGYEHGNQTGVRMPVKNVSRWVDGQFADGFVRDPLA